MRKIVFDIETKNIFDDVGKNDPVLLDIAVVAIHDSETQEYSCYSEEELPALWPILEKADMLIGYNSDHFDIPLLNKYYPGDITQIKSIDIMEAIKKSLGRRLSLNNVVGATLGLAKTADGLQAYYWWKEGKIKEIREYCINDVKVTKTLYEHIVANKKIMYKDGPNVFELPLDITNWETPAGSSLTHTLPF